MSRAEVIGTGGVPVQSVHSCSDVLSDDQLVSGSGFGPLVIVENDVSRLEHGVQFWQGGVGL